MGRQVEVTSNEGGELCPVEDDSTATHRISGGIQVYFRSAQRTFLLLPPVAVVWDKFLYRVFEGVTSGRSILFSMYSHLFHLLQTPAVDFLGSWWHKLVSGMLNFHR